MDRYVFCPDESMMEEAVLLAKEWSLPILNGDSERSKNVHFDRNIVSVVLIPIFNGFENCPEVLEPNMAYIFRYRNDFMDCGELVAVLSTKNLGLNKSSFLPIRMVSPHEIEILVTISSLGEYSVMIAKDKEVFATHDFAVLPDGSSSIEDLSAYD